MMLRLCRVFSIFAVATAYSTAPRSAQKPIHVQPNGIKKFTVAAALAFALASDPQASLAESSATAAHISLNSIPPTSVKVDIKDLPVVGNLISGTYTRVDDTTVATPSVSITSPDDKVSAIKAVASMGHLEFDVDGILNTHLDVDIATDKAGVATIKVTSPIIPKLPFRNAAGGTVIGTSGKPSEWYKVTNMGTGESYYYNEKKDFSQLEVPSKF